MAKQSQSKKRSFDASFPSSAPSFVFEPIPQKKRKVDSRTGIEEIFFRNRAGFNFKVNLLDTNVSFDAYSGLFTEHSDFFNALLNSNLEEKRVKEFSFDPARGAFNTTQNVRMVIDLARKNVPLDDTMALSLYEFLDFYQFEDFLEDVLRRLPTIYATLEAIGLVSEFSRRETPHKAEFAAAVKSMVTVFCQRTSNSSAIDCEREIDLFEANERVPPQDKIIVLGLLTKERSRQEREQKLKLDVASATHLDYKEKAQNLIQSILNTSVAIAGGPSYMKQLIGDKLIPRFAKEIIAAGFKD